METKWYPLNYKAMTAPTAPDRSPTVSEASAIELAQALAQHLTIAPQDWHRLKANRQAQASQHISAALVYLLKTQPEEALPHLQQAAGWLDGSVRPLPCPTHGNKS